MTILIETRAKKNRGAIAPRRETLTFGYLLWLGLISRCFLRKDFRRWWYEDSLRIRSRGGMDCFLAS